MYLSPTNQYLAPLTVDISIPPPEWITESPSNPPTHVAFWHETKSSGMYFDGTVRVLRMTDAGFVQQRWKLSGITAQSIRFAELMCRKIDRRHKKDDSIMQHCLMLSVYSDADQKKHQSSASLTFVRGIHRGPVNSPHKWPVTRKIFPFDYVIMSSELH